MHKESKIVAWFFWYSLPWFLGLILWQAYKGLPGDRFIETLLGISLGVIAIISGLSLGYYFVERNSKEVRDAILSHWKECECGRYHQDAYQQWIKDGLKSL